jgi:hypothetical protein
MLISFGEIPHPGASIRALEASVKSALVKASDGYEMDPETPDNFMAVLLPALKMRGLDQEQIVSFITDMNLLRGTDYNVSGGNGSGVLTPPVDDDGGSGWGGLISGLLGLGSILLTGGATAPILGGGLISSLLGGIFD